ncbi:CDP-paratose 2-epimerase [Candidatus Marinamargulisbacteria bacterium SCGC AG-343-D04]|nr:CDP-paratose 2-epimerase [Candidatus Marinamargulisbacteria bacterium SCGC AG-343-D04]
MHEYYNEIVVPEKIQTVFEFFNTPENLQELMPSFMSFKLLTPGKLETKEGAVFDYIVKVFGIPNRWTTYITDYDPPYSFADIQLKGPNSYWHHVHTFKEVDNGTLVSDHIHYILPFGLIGKLGKAVVMGPLINSLFNHRSKVIKDKFGSV